MRIINFIFAGLILACGCSVPKTETGTESRFPLREYVMAVDPAFQYDVVDTLRGTEWTTYQVKMVSGAWLTEQEVEPTRWWHWLTIIVPDEIRESESMMFIGGGSAHDTVPPPAQQWLAEAAVATGSVISHLSNIPFQPVNYSGDEKGDRYEDDLIAYGWRQYLESGASEEKLVWLARFPMTRAVVRAMDVVQEMSASFQKPVEQFFVTGASKRGWTTWTTAAVDDRVLGIAPIVIDLLNIVPSFQHHWRCYGEWSPAIEEYVHEGIMNWMDSGEFATMLEMVEPYSFRDRLTMPKLLINASGDEFFVTDSWKFYWNDLKGENYLQYVPNGGHGFMGGRAAQSLISFYNSVITGSMVPEFSWKVGHDTIFVEIDPSSDYMIQKWEAVNDSTRDFRIYVIGEAWIQQEIQKRSDGIYTIPISEPEIGYKAALVEVVFNPQSEFPLTFTSGTVVTPDRYPFEPFEPEPEVLP